MSLCHLHNTAQIPNTSMKEITWTNNAPVFSIRMYRNSGCQLTSTVPLCAIYVSHQLLTKTQSIIHCLYCQFISIPIQTSSQSTRLLQSIFRYTTRKPPPKLLKSNTSGNAGNNDALNSMTQAELEGDNNFSTPLIGRNWDSPYGTAVDAELVADEDIPFASSGSPLISNNQGLYSNTTLGGSDTTHSPIKQNSNMTDCIDSIYFGAEAQIYPGRAHTSPNMEWFIGTYPRQYQPISSLPESEEDDEDRVFTTAPNSPVLRPKSLIPDGAYKYLEYLENRFLTPGSTEATARAQVLDVPQQRTATPPQDRLGIIAFVGTDVRAATRRMMPQLDASGRPMHNVDENGERNTSGLFMVQVCTVNIVKCIEKSRYPHSHDTMYEFCNLFTQAATMTKHMQNQSQVDVIKEHDKDYGTLADQSKVVNVKIVEHIEEHASMADLAIGFLDGPIVKKGIARVEEARAEYLQVLKSKYLQVLKSKTPQLRAVEKTWRTWDHSNALTNELAQAVYMLGIVRNGRIQVDMVARTRSR